MDVNEELNFLGKFTKKNRWGVREGRVSGGGSGWWWVRVDVNAMLGVGVMWGMGDVNQEWKVLYNVQKGIVQYQENEKMWGGRGRGNI